MATGESRLSQLGGLARGMPVLAAASGVAAATLAALPLTLGFFKDELFFGAARDHGSFVAVMAVVAAALTFAYIGRFWLGLFAGPRRADPRPVGPLLVAPVAVLAAVALAGGFDVGPFAELAGDAATVTHGATVAVSPAYHLDARAENVMAVAAWLLGAGFLFFARARARVANSVAGAGDRFGPRRWYGVTLRLLNVYSDRLHGAEVRDLRNSIAAVLLPTGVLVALGFAFTPTRGSYSVGAIELRDLPILVLLALCVASAFTVIRDPGRLRPVLALSVLGFALAGVYAVAGAPDVALVAVLVETIFTLVFVGVFSRLPQQPMPPRVHRSRRWRNVLAGLVASVASFAAIWAELSRTTPASGDAADQIARARDAHGGDVVTVILADFRGLDTMVEITVLAVAVVGVASLLRQGRSW
jgi:multicomponent Na+:H+ antiporter subunit A